jgi:type IV fimbrial biogenesis protein FimT
MLTVRSRPQGGFTLIEMMVGLALLAFILMLGLPSFGTFLQNQKLRDAGAVTLAAVQFARGEAIRLNSNVQFVMSDDVPNLGNFAAMLPSTTGRNFLVRGNVYDPATGQDNLTLLTMKSGVEGSGTTQESTAGVALSATTGLVTFTPLGGTTNAADEVIEISNPSGGTCKASGGTMRCMNVVVLRSGQVRMCDPAVTTSGDTRRC